MRTCKLVPTHSHTHRMNHIHSGVCFVSRLFAPIENIMPHMHVMYDMIDMNSGQRGSTASLILTYIFERMEKADLVYRNCILYSILNW